MKISAIIPNHNNATTFHRSLGSLLRQLNGPEEIVILDDASTDNTAAIVEGFAAKDARVRLLRCETKADNWLKNLWDHFIDLDADFVHSLGADDGVMPGFYFQAREMLGKYPQAACLFSDSYLVAPTGVPIGMGHFGIGDVFLTPEQLPKLLVRPDVNVGGAATLVNRDALRFLHSKQIWELGPWNDSVGYAVAALRSGAIFLKDIFGAVNHTPKNSEQGRTDDDKRTMCIEAIDRFLNDEDVQAACHAMGLEYLREKVYDSTSKISFVTEIGDYDMSEANQIKINCDWPGCSSALYDPQHALHHYGWKALTEIGKQTLHVCQAHDDKGRAEIEKALEIYHSAVA